MFISGQSIDNTQLHQLRGTVVETVYRDPATGLPTYNPSGEHPAHLARARPSGMSSEALLFLSLLPQASTS